MLTMHIFKKDQNDIYVINSKRNTIRFLSEEEKVIILEILPQLCYTETISIMFNDLPEGARVIVEKKTVQ